jgi:hypothetical protein
MIESWNDFPLALQVEDLLRGQGMDPASPRSRRPAFLRAAEAALERGLPLLQPAAVLRTCQVLDYHHERIRLEEGVELAGSLIGTCLAGARQVAAVLCTIGPQLETEVSGEQDALLALALDGLGNAAVGSIAQQVCARVAEQAQSAGLQTSTPLSPGEPEWPVDVGQKQIFSLLENQALPIRLNEGQMMIPKKSISFVLGIGPQMTQTGMCELCSLNERCRYRHG